MTNCTPCWNRYVDSSIEYKPNLSRGEECRRCGNDWKEELREMGLWEWYCELADDLYAEASV